MEHGFLLEVGKPEETMLCGEIMGKLIPRGSIVGLTGDLGAGKRFSPRVLPAAWE